VILVVGLQFTSAAGTAAVPLSMIVASRMVREAAPNPCALLRFLRACGWLPG